DTTPHPAETCGASTRGIRLGDNPPYHLGPCVLRAGHDGPIHQTADGVQWMGDVGSDQPTVPGPDVPDGLLTLAAVLPAHERQVREQVARDIEANPSGECSGAVAECARIARGTDPADPPDPRLSELTTRAAAIDLPSDEPDITDALRRIRRDIRRALTSRYDPHASPAADLERELGNMIVSSLRWMRVYGLDPLTCIETAERVQRERAERE